METVTQGDLQEIKTMLTQSNKAQQAKFDTLTNLVTQQQAKLDALTNLVTQQQINLATLKEGQNNINTRLDDMKTDLSKRLDDMKSDLSKRLETYDYLVRTIIAGVVIALIVGLIKILYPDLQI